MNRRKCREQTGQGVAFRTNPLRFARISLVRRCVETRENRGWKGGETAMKGQVSASPEDTTCRDQSRCRTYDILPHTKQSVTHAILVGKNDKTKVYRYWFTLNATNDDEDTEKRNETVDERPNERGG